MKAKLIEMDVAVNTAIQVQRHTGFESHLLTRRNVAMRPRLNSLPAVRNIPFGVRGRRRNRRVQSTIMFVGIQANPDGTAQRSPVQATPSPQMRPGQWIPARGPTPHRVYRRLTFTSPTSPDQNVLASCR